MSTQLSLGGSIAPPVGDEFDLFWAQYPRKDSKAAARRAFEKARRRASFADLMAGLLRYRFNPDRSLQPHASTWLNGDRWEDEVVDLASDAWGLAAWYEAQPAETADMFSVRGWTLDALVEVMIASGLDVCWRGDLDTLGAWLCAGYRPDSIALVLAEDCAGSPASARTLRWFDRAVRRSALRWNAVRSEWVRS